MRCPLDADGILMLLVRLLMAGMLMLLMMAAERARSMVTSSHRHVAMMTHHAWLSMITVRRSLMPKMPWRGRNMMVHHHAACPPRELWPCRAGALDGFCS